MRFLSALVTALVLFSWAQSYAKIHDGRALEADPFKATEPIAPKLDGLGDYQFPITTKSSESQLFFNQGLNLTYAFNHSEALRAFKEAVRLDPDNAMAYWGWTQHDGPARFLWAIGLPLLSAVIWGVFTVPDDRSRSGKAPVPGDERVYNLLYRNKGPCGHS